jgi:hypothetical protein
MRHLFPNDDGEAVIIHSPSHPTALLSRLDAARVATVTPGGELPAALNGVVLAPCSLPQLDAASPIVEPSYVVPAGLQGAPGAVVIKDDGRIWLV